VSDTPGTMNGIGWAVKHLQNGDRVRRAGWNGKGMWLALVDAAHHSFVISGQVFNFLPYVGMKTADDKFVPWLCSQTDLLATDWELVEERLATERDAMQPFFAQAILQLQHMLETNQLKGRKPEDVIVVLKM